MTSEELISFAGDVQIKELTITSIPTGVSFNALNQVIGINIYEDMFNGLISGNIVLKESLDLLNNLPLTGQEFLNLTVKTPTLEDDYAISGTYFIYKVSDREEISEKNYVYKLDFISLHSVFDVNTKISKGYEGKISDIAKDIISNIGAVKIGRIEETKNSTKYVSNYWTPTKNLSYLCNQAVNQMGSPSFVFFENRMGVNFVSIESLINQEVSRNFNHNLTTRKITPTGQAFRNIEDDFERINEIIFPDNFDTIQKLQQGAYATTLISYDLVSKRYRERKFDYRDTFDTKPHLNSYPLTAKAMQGFFTPNSKIIIDELHYGVFNGYGDISNNKTKQARISLLNQIEGVKVRIVVPGRTDYTVGMKVNLQVMMNEPLQEKDTTDDQLDRIISGDYLVAAINHSISRERHECTMELVKDSLLKNVETAEQ